MIILACDVRKQTPQLTESYKAGTSYYSARYKGERSS